MAHGPRLTQCIVFLDRIRGSAFGRVQHSAQEHYPRDYVERWRSYGKDDQQQQDDQADSTADGGNTHVHSQARVAVVGNSDTDSRPYVRSADERQASSASCEGGSVVTLAVAGWRGIREAKRRGRTMLAPPVPERGVDGSFAFLCRSVSINNQLGERPPDEGGNGGHETLSHSGFVDVNWRSGTRAIVDGRRGGAAGAAQAKHCWIEYETGNSACAASEKKLAEKVLREFNTVFVNSGNPTALANASKDSMSALSQSRLGAVEASATTSSTWILGVVYIDRSGGGYSWTNTTTRSNPCAVAGSYPDAMFNSYWGQLINDNIESVYPQAPCRIKLWVDNDAGGSSTGWLGTTSDLGSFRNVASYWQYSR